MPFPGMGSSIVRTSDDKSTESGKGVDLSVPVSGDIPSPPPFGGEPSSIGKSGGGDWTGEKSAAFDIVDKSVDG